MKCLSCGHKMTKKKDEAFHYAFSGLNNIYLNGIIVYECENAECQDEEVVIPNQDQLHSLIAKTIAKQERTLLPEEIRFLRVHLGFSGKDFAEKLSVSPETVSRWEKGSLTMSVTTERFLRVLILSKAGPFREYDELEKFASKQAKATVKHIFKVTNSNWIANAA